RAGAGPGRGVGVRGDCAEPRCGRRHPRLAAPRSRPDRVARDLRAADLADPVLPVPVRRQRVVSGFSRNSVASGFSRNPYLPASAANHLVRGCSRILSSAFAADPMHSRRFSYIDVLLLLMTIIWGTNYSIVKRAFLQMDAQAFNAARMVIASAVFLAIIGAGRVRARARRAAPATGVSSIFVTPDPITRHD